MNEAELVAVLGAIPKETLKKIAQFVVAVKSLVDEENNNQENQDREFVKLQTERDLLRSRIVIMKEEMELLQKEIDLEVLEEVIQFPGIVRDDILVDAKKKTETEGFKKFLERNISCKSAKQTRRLTTRMEKAFYFSMLAHEAFLEFIEEADRVKCLPEGRRDMLKNWANTAMVLSFDETGE